MFANDDPFSDGRRNVERNPPRTNLAKQAEGWRWEVLWRWSRNEDQRLPLLPTLPIARMSNWIERVNEPLRQKELTVLRDCVGRGRHCGGAEKTQEKSRRFG